MSDVQTILDQATGRAAQLGMAATIAVTDREGNILGAFEMAGAPTDTMITAGKPLDPDGLEGLVVPSVKVAISKAGTAAYLSSNGNAFTTRTASFVTQEHFPSGTPSTEGGPLFGVQFSQLPGLDVAARALPLGMSADPGSAPIYRAGQLVGGVGVELDGRYDTDDSAPVDSEEDIAITATRGYEAPAAIRADRITINGIALRYSNVPPAATPAGTYPGRVLFPVRATPPSRYRPATLGGMALKVDARFFPPVSGAGLTAAEITGILTQAARQANQTRSGIQLPLGSPTEVNITVVDATGAVLGVVSTPDAPQFGFDVSAQLARTAAFFSSPTADAQLRSDVNNGRVRFADVFADYAKADGVLLNGSIVFSSRGVGSLDRPFFPDGIETSFNGPLSKPINRWSVFNTGLQSALVRDALAGAPPSGSTGIPALRNGMQIHGGGIPLYRNGQVVGAIGISGDGIDQDEHIGLHGATGFEVPAQLRSDNFFVRGHRLPYAQLPSVPNR